MRGDSWSLDLLFATFSILISVHKCFIPSTLTKLSPAVCSAMFGWYPVTFIIVEERVRILKTRCNPRF